MCLSDFIFWQLSKRTNLTITFRLQTLIFCFVAQNHFITSAHIFLQYLIFTIPADLYVACNELNELLQIKILTNDYSFLNEFVPYLFRKVLEYNPAGCVPVRQLLRRTLSTFGHYFTLFPFSFYPFPLFQQSHSYLFNYLFRHFPPYILFMQQINLPSSLLHFPLFWSNSTAYFIYYLSK